MERVRFGSSGLFVSPLSFGTMTLGSPVDAKASDDLLDLAFDAGVTFFDTANMYNGGTSEEILGRWMKARNRRNQVLLSSKVRYPVAGVASTAGLSASVIHREVDASLKRLQTDFLDILFLHQPDDDTPIEVTLRAVDDLTRLGKVRTLGLSNYSAWQSVEAIHHAIRRGWNPPRIMQPMLNLVARGVETELLPMTRAYDMGNCVYNPLAGGLLTEKQLDADEAVDGTRLATNSYYRKRYWHPSLRDAAKKLRRVAEQGGRTLPELALRYLLDHEDATTVLVGATSKAQLESSLSVASKPSLSTDERAACDSIWQDLVGPIPRYCRTNEDAKMH